MKNLKFVFLFALVAILFTSCTYVQQDTSCLNGNVYGFWGGLWHGMIAGISFIGSLFNHEIAVYAINNNGAWYNLGFLFGVSASLGSSKVVHTIKKK